MAVRSCLLVWPQSHAVVEYTRDTGKASWQDARCENLRLSYALLLLLSHIGRYPNYPPSISLHRIPTLTARIRLSSVEREKEEGACWSAQRREGSHRDNLSSLPARNLDARKNSSLSWCPSVHTRQRHTRLGICLLDGHLSCVRSTLHGSSCSHTMNFIILAFYVCFCHADRGHRWFDRSTLPHASSIDIEILGRTDE